MQKAIAILIIFLTVFVASGSLVSADKPVNKTARPVAEKCQGNGSKACPTPSSTPSPTATATATATPTVTASPTASPTPTATPTETATPSPTPTATPTATPTPPPTPLKPLVAMLDTGCQYEHAALAGKVVGTLTADWLLHPDVGLGQDDSVDGHGTKVCGIIAGAARENWGAPIGGGTDRILSAKVCSAWGVPFQQCADQPGADADGVAAAVRWAVDSGARIINASLASNLLFSPGIYDAVEYACAHGVTVVAAAGNGGEYDDGTYPLGTNNACMIVVGGGGYDQSGAVVVWTQSTRSSYVDVLADPIGTVSTSCVTNYTTAGRLPCDVTWNGEFGLPQFAPGTPVYAGGSGTSFAAPRVTHTIIEMLIRRPALTPAQIESILRSTAVPAGGCEDGGCGAGLYDAAAAIAAVEALP